MLTEHAEKDFLQRIRAGLDAAAGVVKQYVPGQVEVINNKVGREVLTEADRKISTVLHQTLLQPGEGWLSEEDVDDESRLTHDIVWIVDPLDGTREFVDGVPEWCISIGLVSEGVAVAGGILNPVTGELFLGSLQHGVTLNGKPVRVTPRTTLEGAVVLGSRQEFKRGEWKQFEGKPFTVKACGSVAYKLALVAAGLCDATWTLSPKHVWDVAAGVALVHAAGGHAYCIQNVELKFAENEKLLPGLVATNDGIYNEVRQMIGELAPEPAAQLPGS